MNAECRVCTFWEGERPGQPGGIPDHTFLFFFFFYCARLVARHRRQLEDAAPALFDGRRRVITEFGRSLLLKAGTTVTRVEHVKSWIPGVKPIALTHVGTNQVKKARIAYDKDIPNDSIVYANPTNKVHGDLPCTLILSKYYSPLPADHVLLFFQFIREAYLPTVWRHRFSLASPDGRVKGEGDGDKKAVYDIAGPMCFQGDYLAKDVELPAVEDGDWLIIHDT